jgi:hypothetical protein
MAADRLIQINVGGSWAFPHESAFPGTAEWTTSLHVDRAAQVRVITIAEHFLT